jgi:hypothetical protein
MFLRLKEDIFSDELTSFLRTFSQTLDRRRLRPSNPQVGHLETVLNPVIILIKAKSNFHPMSEKAELRESRDIRHSQKFKLVNLWMRLAGLGWQVAVTGRRKNLLDEIVASKPDAIFASAFDADETGALPGRLEETVARLDGMDLLVICAGCGYLNADLSPEPELQTVATNVAAFTVSAAWAFNYFKKQGHGHITAITSVGGMFGEGAAPAYSASKAYRIIYID